MGGVHEGADVDSHPSRGKPAAVRAQQASSPVARPRPIIPVALGLAGGIAILGAAWLTISSGRSVEFAIAFFVVPAAFLASGVVAWRRRPERRLGAMLMSVAAVHLLVVPRLLVPELAILGAFILPAADVAQAYVLLAFPADRINGRLERIGMVVLATTFASYVVLTALTLEPLSDVPAGCPPCGPNPFRVVDDVGLTTAIQLAFAILLIAASALVIGLIIRRWVVATGPARRVLAPVLFGGVVFALGVAIEQALSLVGRTGGAVPIVDVGSSVVRALIPIGLVVTFLRLEAARDDVVGTAVQIGAGLSAGGLEDALRRALHDPLLTVGVWSEAASSYLDREGRHIAPRDDGRQSALRLQEGGRPLAVVVHDPAIDDPALVDAIGAAVRLAVDASRMRDRLEARGSDVAALPRGDVTFLFGDIESSTELLARIGDRYVEVLDTLRSIVRSVAAGHTGHVVDVRADECFLAFSRPGDAVAGAIDLQVRIAAARPAGESFRFRIGLHRGHPDVLEASYVGLDVHLAARVMAAANGGQIVVSAAIVEGAPEVTGATYLELGDYRLKGIPEPVGLARVDVDGLEPDARPVRAERAGRAGSSGGSGAPGAGRPTSPPSVSRSDDVSAADSGGMSERGHS